MKRMFRPNRWFPLLPSTFDSTLFLQLAIVIFGGLALSGCLPTKQAPLKIDYYTLDYPPPQSPTSIAPLPVILEVNRFSSAPEYRTEKIVYQEQKGTISAYAYHRWRATPADLLTYYLARDLQSIGSLQAVTNPAATLTPTHRLEGVVDKFLEVDADSHWQAILSITITLIKTGEPDVSRQVLAQQALTTIIQCQTNDPLSVSKAMAVAMAETSTKINVLLLEKLR